MRIKRENKCLCCVWMICSLINVNTKATKAYSNLQKYYSNLLKLCVLPIMVLISFSENKCIIFLFCSSVNEFIFRLIENRLMNASSRISNRFVAASTMILFGNLSNSCINVIVILLISPSVPPPFPFFLLQLIFCNPFLQLF